MNECSICYGEYPDAACFTLPNCLHKFCKTCLIAQFETKIKDLQINLSDFICPLCRRLFSPDILEHFLPLPLYQKYCEFAFQTNWIYGLEDYEQLTNCLNEDCKEKFIIWKDAEYATCPSCKKKFCRKCQLEYHDGITCESQKAKHQDNTYLEMKKTLKVCRCPKCRNVCEKINGCNYMYCKCKTHFCFLCDVELIEKYHCSHFQNNDPYNSPCRIWQDDTWVDPKDVRPKVELGKDVKIEQVIKPVKTDNKIPCPSCFATSTDICELILFDKFVHCKSVKCKNLAYCVVCAKGQHINDIINHLDQQLNCKYK